MLSIGVLVAIVVILALAFDYINGFHDTANAIATSVSTRALSPRNAIILAASLNFLGAISGTAVAKTIGKDIVSPDLVTQPVIIAALLGAIFWNLLTWYYGIPSSSSHALIGGLVGAVVMGHGITVLKAKGLIKILTALILSPILGLCLGFLIMTILYFIFGLLSPSKVNKGFRKLQVLSAAMAAFSHGSNDAQKSMGIITMALFSAGFISEFKVPLWVIFACATAMGLGTASGGWRIIRTMGGKIFKMEPINGFSADLTSSIVIYSATALGAPVSTTHVVSSSIMGVGAAKRFSAVKWPLAQQIVTAWVLTIPSTAFVSAALYFLFYQLG
mgnify:CR=1 FL=1